MNLARQELKKKQLEEIRGGKVITCTNCEDFDIKLDICTRWNMKPPATVIVVGCDNWMDDIPF